MTKIEVIYKGQGAFQATEKGQYKNTFAEGDVCWVVSKQQLNTLFSNLGFFTERIEEMGDLYEQGDTESMERLLLDTIGSIYE